MKYKALSAVIVVALLLSVSAIPVSAESSDSVLVDYGNGSYTWFTASSGTYGDLLKSCCDDAVVSGSDVSVGNLRPKTMTGDDGTSVHVCWRIFVWDGSQWIYDGEDYSKSYEGGDVAFGYYPEGISPVANPDSRSVWTMMGGSAEAYGRSDSYGTDDPELPVEWYRVYNTGYVDSGLVVAGNYLYHTTGGVYGAHDGTENAYVYCINRLTGDEVWRYEEKKGAGYEVTTPLIVDKYLIVTFTNGYIAVLDRETGDVADRILIEFEPPVDEDKNIVWDGRIFVTGATTPVYDSGCIYFGTADGRVCSYTLSNEGKLSNLWTFYASSDYRKEIVDGEEKTVYEGSRGCFYFHAPTVVNIDGRSILYIGNYEGYLFAIDASDGTEIWNKRIIDLRKDNPAQPGTPGSVTSITVSPDRKTMVVGCTDGALFSLVGYIIGMDPVTGEEKWRLSGLFTPPATDGDALYSYLSVLSDGSSQFKYVDGSDCEGRNAIFKYDWNGNVIWVSKEYQMIKGQLTVADGRVYAMDYSAGKFWPTGGGVTSLDAKTGEEVWRLQLKPYTEDSYSMAPITVIDGRIYAANDLGAVYCISEIAGPGTDEEYLEMLQTVGFHHWSWGALIIVVVASFLVARRFY